MLVIVKTRSDPEVISQSDHCADMDQVMDSNKTNSKSNKANSNEAAKTVGKITTKPPSLPAKSVATLAALDLADDTEYGDFVLQAQSIVGQTFDRVTIERAFLKQVRWSTTTLAKSKLVDIRFENCDLSNSEFQDGKFTRVEMVDCKVTGLHITDAEIGDLLMQNCTGGPVQFHDSVFKRTMFHTCNLRSADFRFCNLEGAVFKDCDLQEAEFYEAKLMGADFRSSNIMGIKAHPADLKGAVIDSDQAALLGRHFATLLGMEVKEG